jgi:hypothetical protein
VKQDDKMAEFIKFLDANTSYMIAFDGDEYREELTINFEEQLLSSSYLKQPLFKPHSKDILQSIKEHSINNKTLRRSSFFFAGDIFSKITTKIGTELKRSASQIYHHTFADHFGLRAWLPETYDSNSQLAPMDFPVIFTDEQEGCFIQFGHFGCLKAEDIRALRESSFGQEYFLKALEFHEKRCGKEEFQRALRRYAVAIKYAIACSSMSQKQSTKDRLRITDKAIFLMGVAVPLAVYGAVSGLEKAMEHGPLFGFSGVAAEWAWHLFATRSEKKIWEKEAANSTAFILDWEKQHKNSRVVKGISPTI